MGASATGHVLLPETPTCETRPQLEDNRDAKGSHHSEVLPERLTASPPWDPTAALVHRGGSRGSWGSCMERERQPPRAMWEARKAGVRGARNSTLPSLWEEAGRAGPGGQEEGQPGGAAVQEAKGAGGGEGQILRVWESLGPRGPEPKQGLPRRRPPIPGSPLKGLWGHHGGQSQGGGSIHTLASSSGRLCIQVPG